MVSGVAVPCCQVLLIICHAWVGLTAVVSNIIAVSVSSVPSYLLNRSWVWGKGGRSHLWREVVPFWVMALMGLGLSTLFVSVAARWSHLTLVVLAANLAGFGLLWVVKYVVLDRVLFTSREAPGPLE